MLDEFAEHLRMDCPPLARIEEINVVDLEPLGEQSQFEIRKSQAAEDKFVLVSPDVASCDQCLSDISDVHNRRFAYPFTNCTNCGPRYTIIRDIPYRPCLKACSRICAAPVGSVHLWAIWRRKMMRYGWRARVHRLNRSPLVRFVISMPAWSRERLRIGTLNI